jgi:hypothetical protein
MDFLKWYKNTIESGQEAPPEDLWDDIQNDLDIDMVYNRLEKSLKKDRRKMWLWRASAAAGILLFLSTGIWLLNQSKQVVTPAVVQNNKPEKEEDSLQKAGITTTTDSVQHLRTDELRETETDIETVKAEKLTFPDNDIAPLKIVKVTSTSATKDTSDNKNNDIAAREFDVRFNTMASTQFVLPKQGYTGIQEKLITELSLPEPEKHPLENRLPSSGIFSGLTFSADGEFANTWLINQKTIEGLDPQNLTATKPTFNSNYGFSIAGNLNERWEIVSSFSVARQNGQQYKEYYHGKYVSNSINLDYMDIALKARYKPFRNNLNHALSAGIYSGFLQNATQTINGETTNITSDYTNTDFGLVAGYQYLAPVSRNITVGAGLFYRMGLKNVFAGNQMVNSTLNHSTNTSFNFSLSVGYTFSL